MRKKADKLHQPPTPSFVATFELEVNAAGFGQLEKRLNAYRQVYNATLGELVRRLNRARKSPEWEAARNLPKGSPERKAAFAEVRKKYGLSVGEAQKVAQRLVAGHFVGLTNSRIVQQVAKRTWRAIEKVMVGKAKRVRFKQRDEFHSFETNANDTGIRVGITTGTVCVGKLTFKFKTDKTNPYHIHALHHRVKYARILKRTINGRARWYVQMILEGKPYRDPKKHSTREGARVGLDFGPSLIAVSTATDSFQVPLSQELDRQQAEIRRLQRRLDRSRRATNPDNYQPNGTIKKGRKQWQQSSRYQRTKQQLKDLERRKVAHRKSLHGRLANRVVQLGNQIHTEKVTYRGWQKQFGRSINHHAPSALEGMLTRKAEALGGGTVKINPFQTARSQTCLCGNRKKKSLSERTHACDACGFTAPRDEFSAYLALHTSWTDGKWVVNLDEARSGIHRHRTLASGLKAICRTLRGRYGIGGLVTDATAGTRFPNRCSTHRRSVSRDTWKRQLRAVCSEQERKRLSGTGRIPFLNRIAVERGGSSCCVLP